MASVPELWLLLPQGIGVVDEMANQEIFIQRRQHEALGGFIDLVDVMRRRLPHEPVNGLAEPLVLAFAFRQLVAM